MRLRGVLVALVAVAFCLAPARSGPEEMATLKVGLLFSRSGSMASSELGPLQASLLAIDEINALGGVFMGEEKRLRLQGVVGEGASEPAVFAQQARKLMDEQGISFFFGCWTSDSRQAVVQAIERRGGLLFYPVQFEGGEVSPAVVYSGITANQQLFPALDFLIKKCGARSVYLVGSDYLYPRRSNQLARQYLARRGIRVAGEAYRPRGSRDFAAVVKAIRASKCDAVLNTINGDSQVAFFEECKKQQIHPVETPIMSLSLGAGEAATMGPLIAGHFTCWGYFMDLDNSDNQRFMHAYRKRYGPNAVMDDPTETAYWQMYAFAMAVRRAESLKARAIRDKLEAMILHTPGGLVRYEPKNLYCWRTVRIAKAHANGSMEVLWSSEFPLKPEPFPR